MSSNASSSASEDIRASVTSTSTPQPFPSFTFLHSSYIPPYTFPPSPPPSFYDLSSWPSDPLQVFCSWYADAERFYHSLPSSTGVNWPNNMQLATTTSHQPHVRNVLCKGIDSRGVIFFTNYEGAKGQQLLHNPKASIVFYWKGLERQVRMEGEMHRVSEEESDDYFHARPLGSQISAAVSCQSKPISSRAELEEHYVGQVKRVLQAVEIAKSSSSRPPPITISPVPSSTEYRSSLTPSSSAVTPSVSHLHHLEAVDALAALQKDKKSERLWKSVVQRPSNWGGLLLRPTRVEFWEDGQYRLHSRIEYQREGRKQGKEIKDEEGNTSDWEWNKRFLAP